VGLVASIGSRPRQIWQQGQRPGNSHLVKDPGKARITSRRGRSHMPVKQTFAGVHQKAGLAVGCNGPSHPAVPASVPDGLPSGVLSR